MGRFHYKQCWTTSNITKNSIRDRYKHISKNTKTFLYSRIEEFQQSYFPYFSKSFISLVKVKWRHASPRTFSLRELNYRDCRRQVNNDYSPCGNFSKYISQTFLNHSSHWFKLNNVYNGMILSLSNRGQMSISIHNRTN